MRRVSKTFRIFVSSSFSDLKAERDALQKEVFPKLRDLCWQHGYRFQAIDLRWGVSEENARDQKTIKICLKEVERCQRTTPRPNFIVLLGDRYGWRPLPYDIPAAEFHQIGSVTTDPSHRELLVHWYRRDNNSVPPVYCLQPRNFDPDDADSDKGTGAVRETVPAQWLQTEEKLRAILLAAVAQLQFTDEQRLKYESSATEQEIEAGALRVEDAQEHVFAFYRQFDQLPVEESAKEFLDLDSQGKLDREAHDRLQRLKDRLLGKLRSRGFADDKTDRRPGVDSARNTFVYEARWTGKGITTDHIESLKQDVYGALSSVILTQIAHFKSVTPLHQEIQNHAEFCDDRARLFVGRCSELDRIWNYIEHDAAAPLAFYGEPGSGKSALMAKAIADCRLRHPDRVIIARFIGATPPSSDGRAMIEALCKELAERYGTDEEDVPTEYQKLIQEFHQRLKLATRDRPLIVFVDALDQLVGNGTAPSLDWLPDKLPPHVHIVVSTLPGQCLSQLEQKVPANCIVGLDPMSQSEGEELLNLWLADAKRRLQRDQHESVMKAFNLNGLPLYLKLAFEEARRWHSYSSAQRFPIDIPGMIRAMFRRLMVDHGGMLIDRALGYIAAARHGLSEDELLDVLSLDKEVFDDFLLRARHGPPEHRLPVVVWSRLYFDLEPYMTERSAQGANLLGFYHRQLEEVVIEDFLASESKRARHRSLGKFFASQDYFLESLEVQCERVQTVAAKPRPANLRKASELAWQLFQAEQWQQLETLLTDFFFLEAKANAGMVFDLANDFRGAKALPVDRRQRFALLLLEEAILRDVHFIARNPGTLFQCLWNSCWWYDSRVASRHYETREGPWSTLGPKLHELLESWCAARQKNHPFYWIRSLRPPAMHLGTPQRAVLRGHVGPVNSLAISPCGRRIISGGGWYESRVDTTVRVWDVETAEELSCFSGLEHEQQGIAISSDGRRIVSGSYTTVRVWDAESGEELQSLHGHEGEVRSVALSNDGRKIISGSEDRTVRVWDAESGRELHCLRGHEEKVQSVALSRDGRRIVSGSGFFFTDVDNTVRVWDTDSGKQMWCLRGHEGAVQCVAISGDGRRAVSGAWDSTVRVWDAENGHELRCLRGHEDKVQSVALSTDGRKIISGSWDCTVRIWDADTGEELRCLSGHEDSVETVAISNDGRIVVSGSEDKTVRIWDAEKGEELRYLRGHEEFVNDVAISIDGCRAASCSWDETVRVWDVERGEELLCLRGHDRHVTSVAISSDGRRIVSAAWDKTVRVWDAASGKELSCLSGHEDGVTSVAVSTDGRRIVSGSNDDTVRVWQNGEEFRCLHGHGGWVESVAISGDGRIVLSGSNDDIVRVWDVERGRELHRFHGHKGSVTSLAVSRDGRIVVSGSNDDTMRLWDALSGECLDVIEGKGDVQAIAASAAALPYRAIARGSETRIEDSSGRLIALFPVYLNRIATHPTGRLWAGANASHVYLIALDGGSDQTS